MRVMFFNPLRSSSVVRVLAVTLVSGSTLSCGGRVIAPALPLPAPPSAPAPAPVQVLRDSVPVVPTPVPASRFVLPSAIPEQRYQVESVARVERDSAGRREEIELRSTARVRLSLQRDGQRTSGSGVVDSFVVQGFERLRPAQPVEVTPPISVLFDLTVDGAQVRVATRPPLANECDRPETGATGLVREMVFRLPTELAVSQSWSDSSAAFLCRGGVPIVVRTRSRYVVDRVEVRDNDPQLVITRLSDHSLDGTSGGAWRTMSVRGTGSGVQTLRVSGRTGALLELEGRSTTVLQVLDIKITQAATLQVRSLVRTP